MKKFLIASLAATALVAAASVAVAGSNGSASTKSPIGKALGTALLWAVINPDGTISRSDGAIAANTFKIAGFSGSYQVGFSRNVTGCTYIATIGNPGAGNPPHGSIITAARAGVATAVFVETRTDPAGALVDRGFHLFVNC